MDHGRDCFCMVSGGVDGVECTRLAVPPRATRPLRRAREAGDKIIIAWAINDLGRVAWYQDHNDDHAKIFFESSFLFFREAHSPFLNPLIFLAEVEQSMGNLQRAQMLMGKA